MTLTLPKRELGGSGLEIDTLGFGCAPVGNLYRELSEKAARDLLAAAWQAGFRYYDTAPHYGQGLSERRVGDMMRPLRGADHVLSTKVGRLLRTAPYAGERHAFVSPMPFDIHYDYSYDGVMRSFEDSIQRLGLARIDILYMHDIGRYTHGDANEYHFPIAMEGGYRALDELRAGGAIQAIGLGVNECEVCEAAMDYGDWDCFLLAGRYTLLEQEALDALLPACERRDCSIVIGGPYNSGILATGVAGDGAPYYNYAPAPPAIVERVRRIEAVCNEFGVSLPAAALRFPLAHPSVAAVIPGLGSIPHALKTLELFTESIPPEFWRTLREQALLHPDAPTPSGHEP